jgi:hypothetical protein
MIGTGICTLRLKEIQLASLKVGPSSSVTGEIQTVLGSFRPILESHGAATDLEVTHSPGFTL